MSGYPSLPLAASLISFTMLSTVPAPGRAHHSSAIYDLEQRVTLDGRVSKYDWANPHVYLYLEVDEESGTAGVWEIEASPPSLMVQRGWSPDTFAAGDQVIVQAVPGRIASKRIALGLTARTADGRTLIMSRNAPALADQATAPELPPLPDLVPAASLTGAWLTLPIRGGLTREFLFSPTTWQLTDKGLESASAYDDSSSPAADCIPYTAPFSMVFPDLKLIEIGEEVTTIRSALDDVERTIQMNVDAHDTAPPSNQGHSIGRWEGDVLVVDTARFLPRLNGIAFSLPSGPEKHLVERFELSEDRTRLTYSFVLDDPEYLAETLTGETQWVHNPDAEIAAAGCDIGNARRYLDGWAD